MSLYNYSRRPTVGVRVGCITIGGANPVRLQSMTNTSTLDTEGSVAQALRIEAAGGELVRLTTQGVREAANMEAIRKGVRDAGSSLPLVADVHFNPKAAFEAARTTDKVRINPGNFVDAARTFRKLEFTDEEYREEIERIRGSLIPFLELCREHDTAVRLGVNHGSLSDRIMSRYGDTAPGMVESVMEYLRICREAGFGRIVISIKASNTVLMVETVRLLAERMEREDFHFPLHLGVTEAGDGEDGRIKSAVGIGTLLAEGLGDTIRVSLSEAPENEIPVAAMLRDHIARRAGAPRIAEPSKVMEGCSRDHADNGVLEASGAKIPVALEADFDAVPDHIAADASSAPQLFDDAGKPVMLTSSHVNAPGEMASWIDRFVALGGRNPIILRMRYDDADQTALAIKAAADLGALLLNGYGSGISIDAPAADRSETARMELAILQAARMRMVKTEYIACPGCGRTLFDLPGTLHEVREATSHLKGLKIGVMGCVVNGPGEMADADYGYVGAGPGRVSIYKGKQLIHKNLPREEALPKLIALIKDGGDWVEP